MVFIVKRWFWITLLLSFCASVLTAVLTNAFLTERIAVIGSFVGLQRSFNEGIAFGINLPPVLQEILILVALGIVGFMALRAAPVRLSQVGFGLILGGGLANIVDRVPDGLVTDLFQVGSFPIFNVADSCITVGVTFLLLEMVFSQWDSDRKFSIQNSM